MIARELLGVKRAGKRLLCTASLHRVVVARNCQDASVLAHVLATSRAPERPSSEGSACASGGPLFAILQHSSFDLDPQAWSDVRLVVVANADLIVRGMCQAARPPVRKRISRAIRRHPPTRVRQTHRKMRRIVLLTRG